MFCSKCGIELPENAKFCGKCGGKAVSSCSSDETQLLVNDDKTVLLNQGNEMVQSANDKTVLLNQVNEIVQDVDDKTVLLNQGNDMVQIVDDKTVLLNQDDKTVLLTQNQSQQSLEMSDKVFGTYKILGIIGKGGGGIVYKAVHTRLQKEVVVKQIKNPNGGLNRNETDLLKEIKHSYLPQVLDFIEENGEAYTVMDYISGSDIDKLVKNGRKFHSGEIIKIAKQLCEAVSYLHGLNPPVIHSDIKPANVMLSDNGDICLIDFNVSLVFNKNASVIGGTRGYAAPEQLGIPVSDINNVNIGTLTIGKITPVVNERSDVYSIGAFLYFMITGETPDANYRCKPLSSFNARVPDGLVQVVAKAMDLNPAKRYKSAAEMLTAIKNIGKLDRRYKALRVRRIVVTTLAVAAMGGFILLAGNGKRVLAEEHEEKYQGYVLEIKDNISDKNFDKAEEIIKTASTFEPTRIEPYYNQAVIYYLQKDWEKCADYPDSVINSEIVENPQNSSNVYADMYEMSAESAFELEQYESAVEMFKKALGYSDKKVECYRDLTIAYARLGEIDKAESSLNDAKERGISSDKLELMQGEISAAKGDVNSAFASFLKAIELTEDDYICFRAILVCDKMMLSDNSKENAGKMITLLEEQIGKISNEYAEIVKEMLANDYVIAEDFQNAADVYGELLEQGNLNYSLQKNYFNILYSKLRDYGKCVDLLKKMSAENSEDYWVEMNLAYVYISIENAKEQSKRDYSAAAESYKKAEELYAVFVKNGKSDPNMDNLRAAVNELKNYGWIKEN
ncbi:MAG: protein kinase [Oscillospiraceae bacterium]